MKLMFKLFLFTAIAIAATPFILKDEYGRPWMTLDKFTMPSGLMPDFSKLFGFTEQITSTMESELDKQKQNITEVYKWQDEEGVWHFSDSDAPDGTHELVKIDSNANVVHIDMPEEVVEEKAKEKVATEPAKKEKEESMLPAELQLLEQAPDLINKAREIDQMVDDRYKAQQKAMKGMGLSE